MFDSSLWLVKSFDCRMNGRGPRDIALKQSFEACHQWLPLWKGWLQSIWMRQGWGGSWATLLTTTASLPVSLVSCVINLTKLESLISLEIKFIMHSVCCWRNKLFRVKTGSKCSFLLKMSYFVRVRMWLLVLLQSASSGPWMNCNYFSTLGTAFQ